MGMFIKSQETKKINYNSLKRKVMECELSEDKNRCKEELSKIGVELED